MSPNRPFKRWVAALLAGLPLLAAAHEGVTHDPVQMPVDAKPPGPKDFPVVQSIGKQTVAGANKTKVVATLVNQAYSNGARQKYLLVDVKVRIPNPAIGLADKAAAQSSRVLLRFLHDGEASAYAECQTELRGLASGTATYSLGLKWNAAHTLMRWGRCDNPHSPGADSLFPSLPLGDTALVVGPNEAILARFSPPIARNLAMPAKNKKKPRPATARLLEGGSYKIKKTR